MNKYVIITAVIMLIGSWGFTTYLKYENKKLKGEIEVLFNNNYAYEQDLLSFQDSINNERGVYKLTIGELNTSRDKIVQELNKTKKELNIKDKELKEMTNFAASIKTDTTINITNIINDSCEFNLRIQYNPQTIFNVSNQKINGMDSLRHSSDISASFKGFIYDKSSWKEPNFFKRLFLFKWGKNNTERTKLVSDNDKITIKDFKVVKVKE